MTERDSPRGEGGRGGVYVCDDVKLAPLCGKLWGQASVQVAMRWA